MLQGIINRMAGNSASCKTWTVTLVAAQLALLVGKQIPLHNMLWVCLIPVLPVLALCFFRLLLFRLRTNHYSYSEGFHL